MRLLVLVPGVKQSQLLDLSLGLGLEFDNRSEIWPIGFNHKTKVVQLGHILVPKYFLHKRVFAQKQNVVKKIVQKSLIRKKSVQKKIFVRKFFLARKIILVQKNFW